MRRPATGGAPVHQRAQGRAASLVMYLLSRTGFATRTEAATLVMGDRLAPFSVSPFVGVSYVQRAHPASVPLTKVSAAIPAAETPTVQSRQLSKLKPRVPLALPVETDVPDRHWRSQWHTNRRSIFDKGRRPKLRQPGISSWPHTSPAHRKPARRNVRRAHTETSASVSEGISPCRIQGPCWILC